MLVKQLLAAALLCPASGAVAQTLNDLPIAYAMAEGSGQSIYLTNDTGSRTLKVYSTPAKTTITHLDLNSQGGEIAFVERRSGFPALLKVLSFGNGSVRTIPTRCVPSSADYDQSGTVLLIADGCNGHIMISTVRTDGTGYQVLRDGIWFDSPRWLTDGTSYVYARATSASQQLCRNDCDPGAGDLLWSGYQVGRMDVGRLHNWVLFDDSTMTKVDADTHATSTVMSGTGGHFSPDDTAILFTTPHSASGDYLQIRRANGFVVRISGKGSFGPTDWRK